MTSDISEGVQIYNIGVDSATSVTTIANIVCKELGYENVPKFQYDLTKIHNKGWNAKHTSDEAVRETVKALRRTQ